MGLLNKLLKMGTGNRIQEISAKTDSGQQISGRTARTEKDWEMRVINGKNVYDKLEACFSSHFPDYEVKRAVSPSEFGGSASARAFTYVLYLDGEAKAVVMVTRHNQDTKKEHRQAKDAADLAGLPFINFFSHFDNQEDYILNRLGRYLKATA